ncbi:MAG: shikimate dehydrogenase [Pseudomonadota bacterium]|nr:shikimate dehydrogenase [Pseudomonadota bacterium]
MIFAEVIGDPIAQSKSPIIHKHWLEQLGIEGDYVRTRVAAEKLGPFLVRRRADPDWRGCNVTIPHKERIIPLLSELDAGARAIGAVNCLVPREKDLIGFNTDIDGVAAALDDTDLVGRNVAMIGAGGGARALIAYLVRREARHIAILVRDPNKAEPLRDLATSIEVKVMPLDKAGQAFEDAAAIVNSSPLGMAGAAEMPAALLEAVGRNAAGATVFDMVTTPAQTAFLHTGRGNGAQAVDGLTMLMGQAMRAFELFFDRPAPPPDRQLRDLLVT